MTMGTLRLEEHHPPDSVALRRALLASILALAIAMGIGRFAYTPILPAMRAAFGLLASSNYLGYLAGALLATLLAGTRAHNLALRLSLLGVVATTALMASTTTVAVWIALRFLAGLASAGVFVLAAGAIHDLLGRRRRPDLAGWFYSGVGLGIALSGLVVLALGGIARGPAAWRADWLGVALLALLLGVPCWAWLPRDLPPAAPNPARSHRATGLAGVPRVVLPLCAAYFLEGAGYIVTGTFLVAIVAGLPGLGRLGADAWILVGLAAAPSTLLWLRAATRLGPVAALVLAYVAQAVGVALPALSGSAWAAAVSALLFGGTFVGISALTIDNARRRVPPAAAAPTIGALTAAFGLGQVAGPTLASLLAGPDGDFGPALLVAAGCILAGALITVATGAATADLHPADAVSERTD